VPSRAATVTAHASSADPRRRECFHTRERCVSVGSLPLPRTYRHLSPIGELTLTPRRCCAFNFSSSPCAFTSDVPLDLMRTSNGLSESSPKNADVPKSPFSHSGSPGAVGRRNNAPNRSRVRMRVLDKHPSAACPARGARTSHRRATVWRSCLLELPREGRHRLANHARPAILESKFGHRQSRTE
jgi:hypothetical protein